MKLESLNLVNFKSIKNCDMNFTNKSIILGANASGKSNLISSMKFLNYILMYGIDDAISLVGGIDNLMYLKAKPEELLQVSFSVNLENDGWYRSLKKIYRIQPYMLYYEFKLSKKKNNQYKIIYDNLILSFSLIENKSKKKSKEDDIESGKFSMQFLRDNNKFISEIIDNQTKLSIDELKKQDSFKYFSSVMSEVKKELMLNNIRYILPPIYFSNNEIFKIYDFDPKLLKMPSQITSKRNLEEDGSNIGVVLERLLKDRTNKAKLFNLLKTCLPNIDSVKVNKNIDKSVSYQISEKYFNKSLYSQFLSDGTVSMLALVISLYFNEGGNIVVLEEPERNLHPMVIKKLVGMLDEVSEDKQIIITTHNTEIVKYTQLEDIICLNRNNEGVTEISRPNESKRVKTFIKNELGIDELFLNGIF